MPSRHFSGFLDSGEGDRLHYWLVESENDPVSDPVGLWLNGGPGASSLMGFLTEFGPYVIAADGGIHYNPYNWAKRANMLFLESPAGVGFSYCDGNVSKVCQADDDTTGEGNLQALRDFFERFPHLGGGGFMIWGESYAGVYVPTLAQRVAKADPPLPVRFLGFSVGNPCTADKYQGSNMGMTPHYALSAGLIDKSLHEELTSECCALDARQTRPAGCNAWRLFDLLTSAVAAPVQPVSMPGLGQGTGFLDLYDTSFTASMHPYWTAVATYLNRADVRKALHTEQLPTWGLFANRLEYHNQYRACHDPDAKPAPQKGTSVLPIYRELVDMGYSVMLYSGDEDPSVQWQGSLSCMRGVGLPEADGRGWRPWFYDEGAVSIELLKVKSREWGPQLSAVVGRDGLVLGGYVVEFQEKGSAGVLTFATVRGVGHMVPQFKPQASLHLFNRVMAAAAAQTGAAPRLAPELPSTILTGGASDDSGFYGDGALEGRLGRWLETAQAVAPEGKSNTFQFASQRSSGAAIEMLACYAPAVLGGFGILAVIAWVALRGWRARGSMATSATEPLL